MHRSSEDFLGKTFLSSDVTEHLMDKTLNEEKGHLGQAKYHILFF